MKKVKLTKGILKLLPSELLVKIGAVSSKKLHNTRQAYPQHTFMAQVDYNIMYSNAMQYAKKKLKLSEKQAAYSVGMEFLAYGPVVSNKVSEGYLHVDTKAIKKENNKAS